MQDAHTLRCASAYQLFAWLIGLGVAARYWPEAQDGVFYGGLIMAANATAMRWSLARLLRQNSSPGAALALMAVKFVVFLAATAAVLSWAKPHPVGFMLGFCTLFCGMLGAAIHHRADGAELARET